ncbi:hypothetical protein ACFVFS_05730 [Kitasatospora sp. NPDC057692]|uniref:hypothetical protein n=1 Tax=Kitasatospora sp. NPDC057692 TaxID=3346215 RepID=UPI0036BBB91E
MTTPPDLRERLIAALDADAMRPRGEKQGLVNVMLAVVEADLAARDAENARLRAEVQAQGEALLRCRTLLASAAGIVLAARTPRAAPTPPRTPMTTMTTDQAEAYLYDVEDFLTAGGLRPTDVDIRDCDELADDGISTVPSAVLTWRPEHPLVDADTHPHGLLVAWSTETGWQYASLREGGSNEQLQNLGCGGTLGAPAQVALRISYIAQGLRLPANSL